MSEPANMILLVDPDQRTRALLSDQLKSIGCIILEAGDASTALRIVNAEDVKVVITELYLQTGEDDDLIHAIRRDKRLRKTRTVAHTHRCLASDRDWAMRAGADAYLIKPTRAERLRYVVSRLATTRGQNASVPVTSPGAILRRETLDSALTEMEHGKLGDTSCIVFGREWWEQLPPAEQRAYRRRAKQARISLRSDSMLGSHFVEVRARSDREQGLSTERPESPYRR